VQRKKERAAKATLFSASLAVSPKRKQAVMSGSSENVIVNLRIPAGSVDSALSEKKSYDTPAAYNSSDYDQFGKLDKPVVASSVAEAGSSNSARTVQLLQDFQQKGNNNEWPMNTSVHCHWCCHAFENTPLGIPVRYAGGKFLCSGCFCSLHCATAYNFQMTSNSDQMWERNSLINFLARTLHPAPSTQAIVPAPPREALRVFGGHLSIEEFRSFHNTGRAIHIHNPPMVAVTQSLEEVSQYDVAKSTSFVPIDVHRLQKYKDKCVLKRNKPLHGSNTLESAMNVRFS
jgi:hypothetical protein